MKKEWCSIQDDEFSQWAKLSSKLLSSQIPVMLVCPHCNSENMRFFFLRHRSGFRGGLWLWCSDCRKYYHSSCTVPNWWKDVPDVPYDQIESVPTIPDKFWSTILLKNPEIGRPE